MAFRKGLNATIFIYPTEQIPLSGVEGYTKEHMRTKIYTIKGFSENFRKVNRKFNMLRIGLFWQIQHVRTQKICEIS